MVRRYVISTASQAVTVHDRAIRSLAVAGGRAVGEGVKGNRGRCKRSKKSVKERKRK